MSKIIDTNMDDSPKLKLDVILRAIEDFSMKINHIEDFVIRLNNDHKVGISKPMSSVIPRVFPSKESTIFSIQEKSPFAKHLDTSKFKKPKIRLLEKFDSTYSKFQGFVNQIQLIMFYLTSTLPKR